MGRKAYLSLGIGSVLVLGILYWKSPEPAPEAIEGEQEPADIFNVDASRAPAPFSTSTPVPAAEEKEVDQAEQITEEPMDEPLDRSPSTSSPPMSAPSSQEPRPFFIEDESKFRTWLESYKSLNGLGFLGVISDLKSPRLTEDLCVQGTYKAATQMLDSPDPAPSLTISMDVCLGESAAQRTNRAELTLEEGSTIRQPGVFPSTGGMPSGFRLIQHEGQISVLVRSAQDAFQLFFFKKAEHVMAIWYQLDSDLVLTRKGSFVLNKTSAPDVPK